jgi:hypothetical protein
MEAVTKEVNRRRRRGRQAEQWVSNLLLVKYAVVALANSLELESVILHNICYFFGMVTLHFACFSLHLAMFAFHFAWYLPRFSTSTSHVHGICYILVLQTFIWVS